MNRDNADTLLDIMEFHGISYKPVADDMGISRILLKRYIVGSLVWDLETLKKALISIEKIGTIKINENELYEIKHRKYV